MNWSMILNTLALPVADLPSYSGVSGTAGWSMRTGLGLEDRLIELHSQLHPMPCRVPNTRPLWNGVFTSSMKAPRPDVRPFCSSRESGNSAANELGAFRESLCERIGGL